MNERQRAHIDYFLERVEYRELEQCFSCMGRDVEDVTLLSNALTHCRPRGSRHDRRGVDGVREPQRSEEAIRLTLLYVARRGGAAEILGFPSSTLRARMKKLGLK